jgi:hypothetical protein
VCFFNCTRSGEAAKPLWRNARLCVCVYAPPRAAR